MTPISHALIPVCLGSRWIPKGEGAPTWRLSLAVALSGVLPDLLNPHLYLDARQGAWSHSLVAWLGFCAVVWAVYLRLGKREHAPIAGLCMFAYGAHLACDAITGGIGLLLPFSTTVWGRHVLPFWAWTASDVGFTLCAYFIYRWVPLRRRISNPSCLTTDNTD